MRRLVIVALLLFAPTASAAGPWLHAGPTGFPAVNAVSARGDTLFALGANGTIWRSISGVPWSFRSRRPNPNQNLIVAAPGALYVSSTDPNILSVSTDDGATFNRCGRNTLPAGPSYLIAARSGRAALIRGHQLAISSNTCRTWVRQKLRGRVRSVARQGTTWWVLRERRGGPKAERFQVLASTNRGETWRVRANRAALLISSPPGLSVQSLVADVVTANRLWLVHNGRLARSDDSGRTWRSVSPISMRVTSVVPDPIRANRVQVLGLTGSRRPIVRFSSNAGASWTDLLAPNIGAMPTGNYLMAASNSRLALPAAGVWTWAF